MGNARIKDLKTREVAFSKSTQCIFCGGLSEATTVDHYPPRSVFHDNRWPEGYVYPACAACNAGSRLADNWAGFLSMMDPTIDWSPAQLEKNIKRLVALDSAHPGLIREFFGSTAMEKRAMARRLKMQREPGQTFADLPIVKIPEVAHQWMDIFAPKLTKALHFEHTRCIPHPNVGLRYWWFTNASQLEGKVPQIINSDFGFPSVQRANVDLSDQFHYAYQVSSDGEMGLFVIRFRFAFMIISAITFDPTVAERIMRTARASVSVEEVDSPGAIVVPQ